MEFLSKYFTDVLIEEPFENPQGVKSTKLFQLQKKYGIDRVFITPHIGGASWQSLKNCEEFIINKLYLKIIENFKNLKLKTNLLYYYPKNNYKVYE